MFVWTFLLRTTNTIISQSTADSSWITLYMYLNGGDYFCGIYATWNTAYRPGRLVKWQYSRNCIHTVPNHVSWSPHPTPHPVFAVKAARKIPATTATPSWSPSHLIRLPTIPAAGTPAVQTFLRLTFQANSQMMPQYFKAQWLAHAPPRSTHESLHFAHAQHLHIPQNLSITVAVSLHSNDSSL